MSWVDVWRVRNRAQVRGRSQIKAERGAGKEEGEGATGRWKRERSNERLKVWDRCSWESQTGERKARAVQQKELPPHTPTWNPPELRRARLCETIAVISSPTAFAVEPREQKSGLCWSGSLLPGYLCCCLGGKKPGLNCVRLLAGAAAMGKAQLAGCLDSSRARSLADSLTVHIWIRKDSLWRREGGSGVWLAPCLEESCLVERGWLQSERGGKKAKGSKTLTQESRGEKQRAGLAGFVQQEGGTWQLAGCAEPCRLSLLVHCPQSPASFWVSDVCWFPKWKSTGTYLLSQWFKWVLSYVFLS